MPKTVLNTLILLIFVTLTARAEVTEFKMFKDEKYIDVKIEKHGELRLTKDCFKGKTPKCEAFEATTKKVKLSDSPVPLAGHPAARFCLDNHALNRILLDKENKQYDYCMFKDGSMVDAWDLYFHAYPEKVSK